MKYSFFIILFISAKFILAQQTGTAEIVFPKIKEAGIGTIYVSLYNQSDNFLSTKEDAFRLEKITGFGDSTSIIFPNLPYGDYAIGMFQDLNDDGKMDTNFLGIPREPFGVSNLNYLLPPKWSRCKFSVQSETTSISIKIFRL